MGHGDGGNPHSDHFRSGGSGRKTGLFFSLAVAFHRGVQGAGTFLPVVDGEVHSAFSAVCAALIHGWMYMFGRKSGRPLDPRARIPDMRDGIVSSALERVEFPIPGCVGVARPQIANCAGRMAGTTLYFQVGRELTQKLRPI